MLRYQPAAAAFVDGGSIEPERKSSHRLPSSDFHGSQANRDQRSLEIKTQHHAQPADPGKRRPS
jgi:hypothetical protein